MIYDPRPESALFSCVVSIESATQRTDEELMAFGRSPEEARHEAQRLLTENYQLSPDQVEQLMQQAIVEQLNPWCSPDA